MPLGHVTGVDQEPDIADLGPERAHGVERIHDRAGPRLHECVRSRAPPAHRTLPSALELRTRRGRRAPRVDGLRERGRTSDRQRQQVRIGVYQRIDVREPVRARREGTFDDAVSRRVHDVDDTQRPPHHTRRRISRSITSPSTWASPCRRAGRAGRGWRRNARRRLRDPSRRPSTSRRSGAASGTA